VIPLEWFGLTLRQHKGSIKPVLATLLLAGCTAAILGIGLDKGPFNPVVLIYLAARTNRQSVVPFIDPRHDRRSDCGCEDGLI